MTIDEHATTTQWYELDGIGWRGRVAATSAAEGVEAALSRIDEQNHVFNAFTQVFRDQARVQAKELDQLADDQRGPLHGIPIAIKEEFDVAGAVTTFGTRANVTPKVADSEAVRRLRDAGAIIIGKTTMPEFGAYPFTSSRGWGVTRNPFDPMKTSGGSSGGSAVAVATGMVPLAMGGDSGGSVRIPAANCGLVGLKPTRGAISTAPYDGLWRNLGTSGPITKTVRDNRLMIGILSESLAASVQSQSADEANAKHRGKIAILTKPFNPLIRVHRDNREAVIAMGDRLAALGYEVVELDEKLSDPTIPFLLSMYPGIRDEILTLEHPERIERRHRVTNILGALVPAAAQRWAEKKAEEIGAEIDALMQRKNLVAIMTPTVASRPAKADVLAGKGFIGSSLASLPPIAFTAPWNVSGNPGLAVPAGTGSDGLPTSVQLVGAHNDDFGLLDIARTLQD